MIDADMLTVIKWPRIHEYSYLYVHSLRREPFIKNNKIVTTSTAEYKIMKLATNFKFLRRGLPVIIKETPQVTYIYKSYCTMVENRICSFFSQEIISIVNGG